MRLFIYSTFNIKGSNEQLVNDKFIKLMHRLITRLKFKVGYSRRHFWSRQGSEKKRPTAHSLFLPVLSGHTWMEIWALRNTISCIPSHFHGMFTTKVSDFGDAFVLLFRNFYVASIQSQKEGLTVQQVHLYYIYAMEKKNTKNCKCICSASTQ